MPAKKKPSSKRLGKVGRTARGFELIEFPDYYGTKCSLQASSLAIFTQPGVSAIWIGPEDANPRVLASEAASVGVLTEETTGWVPFPVPAKVSFDTRAHLHRDQVKALIHHLQSWIDTGSFKISKNEG